MTLRSVCYGLVRYICLQEAMLANGSLLRLLEVNICHRERYFSATLKCLDEASSDDITNLPSLSLRNNLRLL